MTVDGKAVRREKAEYLLPGVDGTPVRARMRGRFLAEHPVLTVGDRDYVTGPEGSPFVLLISFLPLLFAFTGSPAGFLLGLLGVLFDLWILRAPRTEAWKTAVILVTFMAAVLLLVFWAFFSSWVIGLIRG
ncbi:MAG TPA: hypothetical protein DEH05_05965 [Propionibacteriaceae bacterium]|nr:hypothetical protein [Propionibacteriaceae bacterium]